MHACDNACDVKSHMHFSFIWCVSENFAIVILALIKVFENINKLNTMLTESNANKKRKSKYQHAYGLVTPPFLISIIWVHAS